MLFRVIIVTFLMLLAGNGFAQKSEIDSLESLIKSIPSDTTKVWLLNRLVSSLREKDNNRAFAFAQEAKNLAELLNYNNGLSHALENLAWIHYRKGDFTQSLDISTQALRVSEEIDEQAAVARCLINIAAIYYEQKQFDASIEQFRKAYYVARSIDDKLTMSRSINNIAYTFVKLNKLDSALTGAQKGLILSESSKDPYMIAFAHRTLGDIGIAKNNFDDALRHLEICHDLSIQHGNTFLKTSVLHRIARVYSALKQYEKALVILHENIAVANQFGFKDESERAYKLISEIYYKQDNIAEAYRYQSLYLALHDSLYDQRSSEQIALIQIRFDTKIKQAQIELLTKDTALKAEDIKRKQVWIYFYVGCLSLSIILAFVLFYNNRYNKRAKTALEEKNREIQSQTHQLRNLNSTKDKLFSIISHDLRSPVASLKALLEIVSTTNLTQEEFVDITKVLKRNLDNVYEDLDNLLLWAQTQLRGLKADPEVIDLRSLSEEKSDLFSEVAAHKNITIINTIQPETMVMADRNHAGLVLRNLIANAVKFNKTYGTITISSKESGDCHEVSVSDSGIGISSDDIAKLFNPETHFTTPGTNKEKGVGIGLLLTKEFIEKNHGSIWVTSELHKGATFTFTLKAIKQEVFV